MNKLNRLDFWNYNTHGGWVGFDELWMHQHPVIFGDSYHTAVEGAMEGGRQ